MRLALYNTFVILVLVCLAGCGRQEPLTPQEEEALHTYQQLPAGVQAALEAKDLRGITFYVTTDDQATKKGGFARVCNEIVSLLLVSGAFRAEKASDATLSVAITSPTSESVGATDVHVTITDQHASVLLQGDFDDVEEAFQNRRDEISWQMRNLIDSLGVERRNKVLADAATKTTNQH
ncbi:MAG: hypothetical protein AAB774_00120 [Patescibacteria group bacterium]